MTVIFVDGGAGPVLIADHGEQELGWKQEQKQRQSGPGREGADVDVNKTTRHRLALRSGVCIASGKKAFVWCLKTACSLMAQRRCRFHVFDGLFDGCATRFQSLFPVRRWHARRSALARFSRWPRLGWAGEAGEAGTRKWMDPSMTRHPEVGFGVMPLRGVLAACI